MKRIWLLLAALLTGCSRSGSDADVSGGPYAKQLKEAIPVIETATGLKFKRPPAVERRSREEVRAFLEKRFREGLTDHEVEGQQTAYSLLGLIPDTLDLRAFLLDLLTEQVVGFYDPTAKVLYLVDGAPPDQVKLILLHELVHALQDQYVNLDSITNLTGNNDGQIAAQSVMEGQATLASLQAVLGTGSDVATRIPGGWDRVRQLIRENNSSMPVFGAAPMIVQETIIFPYLSGAEFMRRFAERKPGKKPFGQEMPVSSEQILHSAAYFDSPRDEPVSITFPAPSKGASVTYENNLGEFETRVFLFEQLRDQNAAVRSAGGWDGDRYAVLKTARGKGLVWLSVWDSKVDAAEFFSALQDGIAKRPEVRSARDNSVDSKRYAAKGRSISLWVGDVDGRPAVLYSDVPEGTPAGVLDPAAVKLSQPRR